MPDGSILDRNLEALMKRAWRPVRPSPEFAARLQRELVARASPAQRVASPLRIWIAAAASVLALVGFYLWGPGSGAPSLDAILARGELGWRTPGGEWKSRAGADGGEWWLAPTAPRLEVATPRSGSVRIDFTPLGSVRILAGGRATFADPNQGLELDPSGVRGVQVTLEKGAAVLEREPGGRPWSVVTSEGTVELDRGELRVAHERPGGFVRPWRFGGENIGRRNDARADGRPKGARLALESEADSWVRVRLQSGRARVLQSGDGFELDADEEVFLRGGEVFLVGLGAEVAQEGGRAAVGFDDVKPSDQAATEIDAEPDAASVQPEPQVIGRVSVPEGEQAPRSFGVALLEMVDLPAVSEAVLFQIESEDGRFEVGGVVPGRYAIFVQAQGYATWQADGLALPTSTAGSPPVEVEVHLGRAVTATGIVIDARTQIPIAGAMVISEIDAPAQVLSLDNDEVPPEVTVRTITAADGGFVLPGLSSGKQLLRVRHPDYAPAWLDVEGLLPGETRSALEVVLQVGGDIEGRVLDENGQPFAGSFLIVSSADSAIGRPRVSFLADETDSDGNYRMAQLPPGRFVVLHFGRQEDAESGQPLDMGFVELAAGEVERVDFGPSPDRLEVVGVVRDLEGEPMGARSISLMRVDVGRRGPGSEMRSTTADEQGRYRIVNLRPGTYEYYMSGRTPMEITYQGTVELPAGTAVFEADLVVQDGTLFGRVLDERSGEAIRAFIAVELVEPGGEDRFLGKAPSSPESGFELKHLPGGTYRVTAYPLLPGYSFGRVDDVFLSAGGRQEVEVRLGVGVDVQLRVSDSKGEPIASALVSLWDASGVSIHAAEFQDTRADGELALPGLRPGPLRVRVSHRDFETWEQVLELEAGADRVLQVVLEERE